MRIRPSTFAAALGALGLLWAAACAKGAGDAAAPDESGGAGGTGGAAGAGAGGVGGEADAGSDAPDDGPPTACTCGSPSCGGCPGVATIAVGNFRIDSIEVTSSAYAAWLATEPLPAAQPALCAFNTSFEPAAPWPPPKGEEERPVTGVDWCDARAYCAWAGKRLCGKIGGDSLAYGEFKDAAKSQWYKACGDGQKAYPYGTMYAASKCNGADFGAGKKLPAGELAECVGGSSGIFNMSGNVWEWEDACSGQSGDDDDCRIRGGSFANLGDKLSCDVDSALPRNTTDAKVGFRCCQ